MAEKPLHFDFSDVACVSTRVTACDHTYTHKHTQYAVRLLPQFMTNKDKAAYRVCIRMTYLVSFRFSTLVIRVIAAFALFLDVFLYGACKRSAKVSSAPKYQTAYACEGKKLTIECDPGDLINLIRANYGRFSITICNDHGNVEWSVNCMFPKSLTVLNSRCAHKQSCSVLATTSMFGDPCPGTHKYLEAHYQCISAAQTSTTTNRPSPPPWVLNNGPPIFANGSTIINPSAASGLPQAPAAPPPRLPTLPGVVGINGQGGLFNTAPHTSPVPPTQHTTLPGGRLKGGSNGSTQKNANRHDGLPPPPQLPHHHATGSGGHHHKDEAHHKSDTAVTPTSHASDDKSPAGNATAPSNTRILTGVGGTGSDDGTLLTTKAAPNRANQQQQTSLFGSTAPVATPTAPSGNNYSASMNGNGGIRTINNINFNAGLMGAEDESKLFCGPINARNLFWNMTRVGDVNVQPCPGGAAGIAKWRCVLMKRLTDFDELDEVAVADSSTATNRPLAGSSDCQQNSSNCELPMTLANKVNERLRNFEPTWHPMTPDLTQCRSLWLNNLEMRVNQRDSSLISIANDLSEVTSSKTLYGGDMLVTTKIIQTMSEKMFHDKETFPDQRQREAIIMELLHGVVKTGSNLLDEAQLSSWLDLNQEDQMRVATSLLTGLEYNAFLLADTIIRERNVVQKVKNILLSVRVLETKNIQSNEVFPDAGQWPLSDDRIELPRSALVENSEGGLVRIVFAAFDRLESILKPSYDHFDLKSARSYIRNTAILSNDSNINVELQQRIRILNSKVISASLGKGRHIQLSQPIKLVLKHLKTENVTNPTCVFWNYIDHAWSANGCQLESTNRTHSICACNHLTNFALLMDIVDDHQHSLFTMFDGNMRIFIYISVAICLVFIVIALLTLKIFSGVFVKSARTSIYRSIYICLLAIELLFLLGIEQTETSKFCGFITVFLHCAILSGIAWFCYEAFHTYTTLTTDDILLEVDHTAKVNCYYLLSYGMSLTVVAISLAINPSTYTENDFCVLMEADTLFYATFVLPVLTFFAGALVYTFLSWVIMCRKSRNTLKTKEHARLANVRFDIRCSFVFLLVMSGVWGTAYFYLRSAKMDDELAVVYGYCFVSFNTLMGLYIFVFHCIQNEKIRREYRKYVRQHAWLPKCLRCSKTSISSGIVGGAGNAGTITSNSASTGTQLKKTKLPLDDDGDITNDHDDGCIAATEDAILATSDCELNDGQLQQKQQQQRRNPNVGALKTGIIAGNLLPHQGHIVLERGNVVPSGPPHTGTLRSTGGLHTPSAGHTSPTSSAGSTHLIFGHKQQQQQQQQQQHHHLQQQPTNVNVSQEAFYHQPDYYAWKQAQPPGAGKATVPMPREYYNSPASPQQAHEVFYWTQKHNQHGKKKRGSGMVPDSPSGSLHSRTTAASQVLFYPSYKKTTTPNMKQQQLPPGQQQYPHYTETLEPNAYYQQQAQLPHHQRHHQRHLQQQQQQQQQQLSSDEEQMASEAHAHLLHMQRRTGNGAGQQLPPPPPHMAQYQHDYMATAGGGGGQQRYFKNKHSNCDLNQEYDATTARGGDAYYNQGSLSGDGGPVYEEILSNRNSDAQHYEVGDFDVDEVYNNSVGAFPAAARSATGRFGGSVPPGSISGGSVSSRNNVRHATVVTGATQAQQQKKENGARRRRPHIDDDDEDADDDEHEESVCDDEDDDSDMAADNVDINDDDDDAHGLPPQSDARMRRLMALQDEDFQRRFQRQLRKNGAPIDYNAPPFASHQPQHQQTQPDHAVFGVSGGVGDGSVRSYKMMHATKHSPSGRLAVNELFNHIKGGGGGGGGPPLPPANQVSAQKRQQQQQLQKLSPQSTTTTTTSSSSHSLQHPQSIHQQQPRNISAMLDENNTVRCYLEPLP